MQLSQSSRGFGLRVSGHVALYAEGRKMDTTLTVMGIGFGPLSFPILCLRIVVIVRFFLIVYLKTRPIVALNIGYGWR